MVVRGRLTGQNRTFGVAGDGIRGAAGLPGVGCVVIPGAVAGQDSGRKNPDFPVRCGQNRTFGVAGRAKGGFWGGARLVLAGCLVSCFRH